jgi:cytoskeletal protein CcmA (bactofilin family)
MMGNVVELGRAALPMADADGGLGVQVQDLSGAGFDQLSRWFIGLVRTRQNWEDSPAACELFEAVAVALDQAAAVAHEPLDTRARLVNGGKVACFYELIDQAALRGPLKWRPPTKRYAMLPQLLMPLVLKDYARRLAQAVKGPVAHQPIINEISVLRAELAVATARAKQMPVTTIAAVTGNVMLDGPLRIVGFVDGNVRCSSLDVAVGATVNGTIVAETVTIVGTVFGTVFADNLTLGVGSWVEADLYHGSLVVEADTFFEGKSRRYASPTSMVPAGWPLQGILPTELVGRRAADVLPQNTNKTTNQNTNKAANMTAPMSSSLTLAS